MRSKEKEKDDMEIQTRLLKHLCSAWFFAKNQASDSVAAVTGN